MRQLLTLCILLAVAAGCTRTVYEPVETVRTDTGYSAKARVDSVICRDSVTVFRSGDTLIVTEFKDRYRVELKTDTVYRCVTDSVTIRVPYPVERKLSRWERAKMDFGGFALSGMAVALCIAVAWLARKFRK